MSAAGMASVPPLKFLDPWIAGDIGVGIDRGCLPCHELQLLVRLSHGPRRGGCLPVTSDQRSATCCVTSSQRPSCNRRGHVNIQLALRRLAAAAATAHL